MRVLVACEFSGVVRDAFIARGHDAMSCDLIPSERSGPHHSGDVMDVLYDGWDLVIAHPPCTYLSRAGARWLYPTAGNICPDRLAKTQRAAKFFNLLLNCGAPRVAVENPIPLKAANLPAHSQKIQPYEHGSPYTKATLLWLRGLPPLMPTRVVDPVGPLLRSNTGFGARAGQRTRKGAVTSAKDASRTFSGIAEAMAEQWGTLLEAAA